MQLETSLKPLEVNADCDGRKELSIYANQPLATNGQIEMCFKWIVAMYPTLMDKVNSQDPEAWKNFVSSWSMLIARNKISHQQLLDGFDKLSKTTPYNGHIDMSIILNHDVKIKFYSYKEADGGTNGKYTRAELYERDDKGMMQRYAIRFSADDSIAFVRLEDKKKAEQLIKSGIVRI